MLAKPQGFPRKLGGCAVLDPRLRSAVSAGVGDGERGLRRGLRAPGVGVRPMWVLEYSPSNKRIRYFVSITYVRTGLWTAHKFCGGGDNFWRWLTAGESGSATLRNLGLLILATIGMPFAIWRSVVAGRQFDIAQRGLRNERYQKAVPMLGDSLLAVRLGGIYALQHLANEHPAQYHIQIMRLFCAFLRHPTAPGNRHAVHNEITEVVNRRDRDAGVSIRADVEDSGADRIVRAIRLGVRCGDADYAAMT